MKAKVAEKAFEYIDVIAEQLGVAAELVFTTLVKQKFIEGVVWSSILIILIIVSSIVYKKLLAYAKKLSKEKENYSDEFNLRGEIQFFSTLIFCILSLIVILALPSRIMQVFNPDYYAIKMLMDMFKGS